MRRPNHASRFEGIAKTNLQASRASATETLQSQVNKAAKKRLSLSGLEVLHGRLSITSFIARYLRAQQRGSEFGLLGSKEPEYYSLRGQVPVSVALRKLLRPVESIYQSHIWQTAAHYPQLERVRRPVLKDLQRREWY